MKRYQLKHLSNTSKKKLNDNSIVNSNPTQMVSTFDLVESKNSASSISGAQNIENSATPTLGNSNGMTSTLSGEIPALPAEAFNRIPSVKNRNGRPLKPPPVPDADGFVPMSPRHHKQRVTSCYDNVPSSNTSTQNNFSPNRGSLKTKKEIADRKSNNVSPAISSSASIIPLDPSQITNIDQIKNTKNLTQKINDDQTQLNRRIGNNQTRTSIDSGSLKKRSNSQQQRQPLSQVVELYQQQYHQKQEIQKNLPTNVVEKSLSVSYVFF